MVLVVLLMIWLVIPTAAHARDDAQQVPSVTVMGQGATALPPDTAFVSIGVETAAKSVAEAQRQNRSLMHKVAERLRGLHIDQERIQTASFTVSPQYKPPPKRPADQPPIPPEIVGYLVSNSLTVEVRNIENVGAVIEESLAAGANQFHGLRWALRNEQQAKLGALKEAATRAREKAAALSEPLKVKLVRLLSATEESRVVQSVRRTRSIMAMDEGSGEMPVFSGEIKVEATVTLIYEIGPE